MKIHGWGNFPQINAQIGFPQTKDQLIQQVLQSNTMLARGLGRSYGDSSLCTHAIDMRYFDHFISFDEHKGLLKCSAGVVLAQIIQLFVPKGWFLPVTPGTAHITIGGAIASDVHGKNHHIAGTFTNFVEEIELLLGNGKIIACSATQNADLFYATCGGMGLTGIIISTTIRLKPITSSQIKTTSYKLATLDALLCAFEDKITSEYSVAWIDCQVRNKNLGRGLLITGEHRHNENLSQRSASKFTIPFTMPINLINTRIINLFNNLRYHQASSIAERTLDLNTFFYPLDAITNWNYLYGPSGLVQYQCVLPLLSSQQGLHDILTRVSASGQGCLGVLKKLGKENPNYLSFPLEGYTLAVDFKVNPAVLKLLEQLDEIVLTHGGRLYLSKDARMSELVFKQSYPRWQEFEKIRAKYHAIGKFASLLSQRIGLQ